MMLDTTSRWYIILTPRLKDYIGVETLKVKIPSGELEIPTNPPVNFITKYAQKFFEERLLIAALKEMWNEHSNLQFIPGDDWCIVINRYF